MHSSLYRSRVMMRLTHSMWSSERNCVNAGSQRWKKVSISNNKNIKTRYFHFIFLNILASLIEAHQVGKVEQFYQVWITRVYQVSKNNNIRRRREKKLMCKLKRAHHTKRGTNYTISREWESVIKSSRRARSKRGGSCALYTKSIITMHFSPQH